MHLAKINPSRWQTANATPVVLVLERRGFGGPSKKPHSRIQRFLHYPVLLFTVGNLTKKPRAAQKLIVFLLERAAPDVRLRSHTAS